MIGRYRGKGIGVKNAQESLCEQVETYSAMVLRPRMFRRPGSSLQRKAIRLQETLNLNVSSTLFGTK